MSTTAHAQNFAPQVNELLPCDVFNRNSSSIDLLLTRRSVKARDMVGPGPNDVELEQILTAGMRTPDHGKLTPWRFLVVKGGARHAAGRLIADTYEAETPNPAAATVKGLATFADQAPVMVVVLATPTVPHKIPLWEQLLSAGAACQNMLVAASSLGLAGQWLTGWPAYSRGVRDHWLRAVPGGELFLESDDAAVAGYLFFGHPPAQLKERPRPAYAQIVGEFKES
ncbi:MAG: nitroreductase [Pseudomonadota bacterium]